MCDQRHIKITYCFYVKNILQCNYKAIQVQSTESVLYFPQCVSLYITNSDCQPATLYFHPLILTKVIIKLNVNLTKGSLSSIIANNFAIQIHMYVATYWLACL